MIVQYIQKEILNPRFWLGLDAHSDSIPSLPTLPELDNGLIDQRRIIKRTLSDAGVVGFPDFRMNQQVEAIIAGPFMRDGLEQRNVISSLQSIASVAIECSAKMRTSCRPFFFSWDECGVMFNHDSHAALNENTFGLPLQQNYMRVALVVTPLISHRIDNSSSMFCHNICKASVLTMH
ncbi:hypothetical protein F5883DRAFT_691579 [Diaporthe sp. PMI_573]|nr:hypothetical protein F5883DRAFT_691579 [Diaporthaceae sp. PMI_573]